MDIKKCKKIKHKFVYIINENLKNHDFMHKNIILETLYNETEIGKKPLQSL